MTVCVAAIAEKSTVIGASDRMLTAGDVEFEPGQAKMWAFSTSIWALISGDAAIQADILKEVHKEVQDWIVADTTTWVPVKKVATLYCQKYREALRVAAEAEILHPVGLDFPTFLGTQQAGLHPEFVSDLAEKLTTYQFPSQIETIFIGIDTDGPVGSKSGEKLIYPQIYVAYADKLSCLNTVGFAAIGIGKSHAESQFMFSGHWPLKSFEETVLLTYAAKKRAEVAPGVGGDTDMVVIGPGLGSCLKVEDRHIDGLERIYQKSRKATNKAIATAQEETKKFVAAVRKEYQERLQTETPAPTKSDTPGADAKSARESH